MKKVFGGGSWTSLSPRHRRGPGRDQSGTRASSKHGHSSKESAPKETKHEGPKITAYVPPADPNPATRRRGLRTARATPARASLPTAAATRRPLSIYLRPTGALIARWRRPARAERKEPRARVCRGGRRVSLGSLLGSPFGSRAAAPSGRRAIVHPHGARAEAAPTRRRRRARAARPRGRARGAARRLGESRPVTHRLSGARARAGQTI